MFPIEKLRQAVETAKRILTKEKLDRQLTGQTSTSPFMNIRDGTDKRVSFSARDELGNKIDKLTVVMSKLAAMDNHERRPFKPQIYKSRGQSRSYDQRTYQTRPNARNRSYDTSNNARQNYQGNRFRGNFRRDHRQNSRERCMGAKEIAMAIEVEIGIGQEREPLQEIIEEIEALIVIDLDQGPEQVQTGIE